MAAAPLQFLLLVFAGWVHRRQREIIEFLQDRHLAQDGRGHGCLTGSPPFMTNTGCSSSVTSLSGSPLTPTRSP